jgi:methionine synthase II (cobalamin-independent)
LLGQVLSLQRCPSIRRIALRGFATKGIALARADLVPEITITADGVYWHPVGAEDADLFVPKGKTIVLGLVTSKKGALETKDDIKRRIDAATKYIDLDQLALSPQCGFASTLLGNLLTEDEQIAKLALIVEVAKEIWGE